MRYLLFVLLHFNTFRKSVAKVEKYIRGFAPLFLKVDMDKGFCSTFIKSGKVDKVEFNDKYSVERTKPDYRKYQ